MKFAKPFCGVKAGEVYPTDFLPGDECPPELIDPATECGVLEQPTPAKPAAKKKG